MARSAQLLLFLCSFAALVHGDITHRDLRVDDLIDLRERTLDGVIHIDDRTFYQYAAGPDRSYSLVLFFSSKSMMRNRANKLAEMRQEFALAAKAFAAGESGNQIFFADVDYDSAQQLFQRFGIQRLPFSVVWSPQRIVSRSSEPIEVSAQDQLPASQKWTAEYLCSIIRARTGLSYGRIERPSFLKQPGVMLLLASCALSFPYAAYVAWTLPFMHSPALWTCAALFVYWFSTSGGMYNIIRGMPMFFVDQQGKVQFFLQGRGQLGVEGFLMGGSYILLSLCLYSVVYVIPNFESERTRRIVGYIAIFVAFVVSVKFLEFHAMKTGYNMRVYL